MRPPETHSEPGDREVLVALNAAENVSRAAVCRLAQEPAAWARGDAQGRRAAALARRLGVPELQMGRALATLPRAAETARREERRARRLGARILTRLDSGYPRALADLALPPPVLYVLGRLSTGPSVAMVGSRKASDYGRQVAALFARSLAEAGVSVVSGFALGIDGAAHRAALEGGGTTVAVLGCGLEILYPKQHNGLRRRIAAGGALVTEFPCGHLPRPWSFPVRNRVIAALTRGTLVVEAAHRSGSLITAHHALELGREVWAVPGSIFEERSHGTNALIRDGAHLVQHPRDVLEAVGLPGNLALDLKEEPEVPFRAGPAPAEAPELPAPEGRAAAVLAHLPPGAEHGADDLSRLAGVAMEELLGELLELELGGWIERKPGPLYRRTGSSTPEVL